MSYAEFLGFFLVVPIALLFLLLRAEFRPWHRIACALVCGIAFVYTAPWDNHAAAIRLWTFDPHFAPPSHFIAFLPWEEYAFYFLQGMLICLVIVALPRYVRVLRADDGQ